MSEVYSLKHHALQINFGEKWGVLVTDKHLIHWKLLVLHEYNQSITELPVCAGWFLVTDW